MSETNPQVIRMRLEILGDITNITKDSIFEAKLDDAKIIALNTLYPFDTTIQDLPNEARLINWQTRCAIELYNKIGNSNVASYSENGLSISYLTGLISNNLMSELVPRAGVPK